MEQGQASTQHLGRERDQLSVKVTTWVWEHSRSRGPARLVLLAIADNAHDDGAQAWPSMTTLVRKTGLGERTVHRAVKQLVSMGELAVDYNAGPGLCNLYRVLMTPAPQTPPSERHPRQSGTPVRDAGVSERHPTPVRAAPLPPSERHPEPSLEPSVNRQDLQTIVDPATPARLVRLRTSPERIFQAWVTSLGENPDSTRFRLTPKRRNAILARLKDYSPEDVEDAVRGWPFDPWPERVNHNDLTVLLRTGEQLEKFRDLYRHGPPHQVSKQTAQAMRTSAAMRARAEERRDHDRGRVGRSGGSAERGLPPPTD